MEIEKNAANSRAAAGAATAFAGLALYAVGQVLSFLFRDVDPKRVEKADTEAIEDTEDTEE